MAELEFKPQSDSGDHTRHPVTLCSQAEGSWEAELWYRKARHSWKVGAPLLTRTSAGPGHVLAYSEL